jgi:hypothetical protein
MSLYNAFLTALSTNCAKTLVVLLDDASDDGSFNELQDFGEKISKQLGVDFFAYKLSSPKGHPYLLYYAYTLACQCFHADYLFKIDHDFIITDLKILDKLISVTIALKKEKINLFSITPAILNCQREYYYKYGTSISQIMRNERCFIGGINKASRNGVVYRVDFNVHSYTDTERLLQSLFTYSTAFMVNIKDVYNYVKNPFFPFFIRAYFDDVFSGIIMTRKGFRSFLYMKLGGIHYSGTYSKINKESIFYFFYNLALLRSLLYGITGIFTILVTSLLASLMLRSTLLKYISLILENFKIMQLSSVERHIFEVNKDLCKSLSKTIIVATIHGVFNSRKYKKYVKNIYMIDNFRLKMRTNFEKYLPCFPLKSLKDILCNLISLFRVI